MSAAPGRRTLAWSALALVAAVFALYWPVRENGFVSYDDEVYLVNNPHVAKGLDWAEIRWVFTHEHAANYHPLTWMSHMLDVQLFALAPGPHHLVNVALHALNAVLVLFLARALLASVPAAAFAAALFALHPLRVQSVAWASERKDVLCATFFLAGLLLYLRYGRRPSAGTYLLVCLALALALLAKPMAVTFPCVALLLDAWPLQRLGPGRTARVVLEKLPLVAIACGGALTTWFAQEVGGAVSGAEAVPLGLRALNALATYGAYLRETFWPDRLAVFHPLAAVVEERPYAALAGPALAGALVVVLVSVLAWRGRARMGWLLVGWCWYLGTLVPVIGLKQVGEQARADRYTYLPLVGVAWIVAGLVDELVRRRPPLRTPLTAACAGALLALCAVSRAQVRVWKDTPTLFEHALLVTEKNHVAHASLGAYWLAKDEPELARTHLEQALAIYPYDASALASLGRLAREAGDLAGAERFLERALRIHASKNVRYELGLVRMAQRDLPAAAEELAAAVALDPSMVPARFNLGMVLYNLGRVEEARAEFDAIVALDPEYAGAHNGLGALALGRGDLAEAERSFARAVELDPEYAEAVQNLGVVLERQGRLAEAQARYAEARRLREPRSP